MRVVRFRRVLEFATCQRNTYSKTCVKRPLKNRQTNILMTNGSLMKVVFIAECSPWSILQYLRPALSDNPAFLKTILVFLRVADLHRFYCTKISYAGSDSLTNMRKQHP